MSSTTATRKPKLPLSGNVKADATALICEEAYFVGDVEIGSGSVIQPGCKILANSGKIVIGNDCVVEEGVTIENNSEETMIIGDDNLFETGCWIESPRIGNSNTFGMRSHAGPDMAISDNCMMGISTVLAPSPLSSQPPPPSDQSSSPLKPPIETLPPMTIIYAPYSERRTWDGTGLAQDKIGRGKMLEYLREVLPKANKIRKTD